MTSIVFDRGIVRKWTIIITLTDGHLDKMSIFIYASQYKVNFYNLDNTSMSLLHQ